MTLQQQVEELEESITANDAHMQELYAEIDQLRASKAAVIAAATDVLAVYEMGGYGPKTSNHMAHLRAAIAKAEELAP